jgi:hypothetical protein
MNTYAHHGSAAFNQWMDSILQTLTKDVEAAMGSNLVALILGGGYGRGEGGVEIIDGKERPYNDLDFTLVVGNTATVPHAELDRISEDYAKQLKIHVDFSRPLTTSAIQHWPSWLMWHDLLNGHIILSGPQDILSANAPNGVKAPPPPIEALRLLLNRGAGLLWAMRVTRNIESEPDRGFVVRNYYKLILALGDALLIAHARFATPYRGRDALLGALESDEPSVRDLGLLAAYRDALRFKFSPHEFNDATIDDAALHEAAQRWASIMLHTEQRRTGKRWNSIEAYASDGMIRESSMHQPPELLKNVVRNLRCGRLTWRHPREWLYQEIPELLMAAPPPSDWATRSAAALAIWDRYN